MSTDVLNYTKSCESCQLRRTKTFKNYGLLNPQIPSTKPLTRIIIDFLGPITQSNGYKYVLVCTDSCTRYAFAVPCRNADAKNVAQKLLELSYTYGFPSIITHDRGSAFMSKVINEMTLSLGITQKPAPAYMPQIQGQTEKFNHVLVKAISHYIEKEPQKWSSYIAPVTFSYNISTNISTGYSPFFLLFGYEANLPSDLTYIQKETDKNLLENLHILNQVREEIPTIIAKAQSRQKYYFDLTKQHLELKTGDEVLISTPKDHTKPYNKFTPQYTGPFSVIKKINDLTYEIQILKYGKLISEPIHVSRIKLFHKRM